MKLPQIPLYQITTIMSHPQSLKQCATNLNKLYPHLKQKSGTKKLIDHALATKHLGSGKLNPHTAILGPKILAEIFSLEIFAKNLQDAKDNRTTFLLVSK